jgi:hypothetical protein
MSMWEPRCVLTFGDFASVGHGFVRDICAFLELGDVALLGCLWAVISAYSMAAS